MTSCDVFHFQRFIFLNNVQKTHGREFTLKHQQIITKLGTYEQQGS